MPPATRVRWVVSLTALAWLLVVPAAGAYVDPGSTSLIFSWIVAGLAAAGMTLRIFWSRLRGFFRRDTATGPDHTEDSPPVRADRD